MIERGQRIAYGNNVSGGGAAADYSDKLWARIEQVEEPGKDDEIGPGDLTQMLAAAQSGKSAFSYVSEACSNMTIVDGQVIIDIELRVYLSDLALKYSLTPNLGEISAAQLDSEERSMAVIFANSRREQLDCGVFVGSFTALMPFFSALGEKMAPMTAACKGSVVSLPEVCTTVLQARGKNYFYRHWLTITIDKADRDEAPSKDRPLYAIDVNNLTVTLAYVDENDEPQGQVVPISLPACVDALLAACPDGEPIGAVGCQALSCAGVPTLYAWFNRCNGEILETRWNSFLATRRKL